MLKNMIMILVGYAVFMLGIIIFVAADQNPISIVITILGVLIMLYNTGSAFYRIFRRLP